MKPLADAETRRETFLRLGRGALRLGFAGLAAVLLGAGTDFKAGLCRLGIFLETATFLTTFLVPSFAVVRWVTVTGEIFSCACKLMLTINNINVARPSRCHVKICISGNF